MFCKNCGNQISENMKFCPVCGRTIDYVANVAGENVNQKRKNGKNLKIAGIAVAVILGLIILSEFQSNPGDKAIDKFESAVVRMEKIYAKCDSGKLSQAEAIVEVQKIMADLEELDKLNVDDSEFTPKQMKRMLDLINRLEKLDKYSYY